MALFLQLVFSIQIYLYHPDIFVKNSLCFGRVIILASLSLLQHERSGTFHNILLVLRCPSCSWSMSSQYYSEVPVGSLLRLRLWQHYSPSSPGSVCTATACHLICFYVDVPDCLSVISVSAWHSRKCFVPEHCFFSSVNGWSWPICCRSNYTVKSHVSTGPFCTLQM